MRRVHYIVGLVGLLVFVLSGQVMRFHRPEMHAVADGPRMMYISRHIYLLGAVLVNLMLGLYLRMESGGWRRGLQVAGCALIVLAPILLAIAFLHEPELGVAGRSARSTLGLFALLGGALLHLIAKSGAA